MPDGDVHHDGRASQLAWIGAVASGMDSSVQCRVGMWIVHRERREITEQVAVSAGFGMHEALAAVNWWHAWIRFIEYFMFNFWIFDNEFPRSICRP
jgi:hypothetical protein